MPRPTKGARIHWRQRSDGPSVWEIRDTGGVRISTGTSSRPEAEEALADYIQRRSRPSGPVGAEDLSVSMCLAIYAEEHAPHTAAPERLGYAIDALDRFWADLPVSAVKGTTCRRYAASRVKRTGEPASDGTIRRELNVLQAAMNHCHREGYLLSTPTVTMPPKPDGRERWLTRQEAAWLLRAARALNRDGRHLADFILHGLCTGSRKATILAMQIDLPSTRGGHVDTVTGTLYRKPRGKVETGKRQGKARLPRRYLSYLRSQSRRGRRFVVEDYRGRQVADIRKGWARAVVLAGELAARRGVEIDLSDATPHTLKHTAITWTLQKGADPWDVAGYFATSLQTIMSTYGHHHPDHQKSAVEAMDRRA